MSPILKSWLMLLGLLFQGKYWEPTIRSLGCYLPFDLGPGISSSFGSGGLSSCQPCSTEQFIMLRGDQCMCLDAGDIPKLDRVRDEYCDIQCPDSDILCGGNLGGNVYCNLLMENCWTFNNVSEPSVDIYRSFDDAPGGFDRLEPCLNAGCGQPDFWNRYNLTYLDYFPNMSPEACVIYCTYERTAYALVGYYSVERFRIMDNPILGTAVMMPVCACSNVTLPANPNASPCTTVPCPSSNGSCGNQDPTLPSWGRYCTTAVQTFANGTTYCAPYQPISSKNDDVDTCISLLLDTTTVEITANEIETTTEPSELTSTEKSKRTIPPTRAISITVPTVESRTEPEEADGTTTTANPASTAIPDASLPSITGCNIPCNNARVAGKEIKNYAEIEPTPTSCESGPCDFGDKTSCYFGTENKCYFNCEIRNYSMNGAERRKAAIEECSLSTNGHLLAIETIEEREFITKMYHSLLEQEGTPCLLTSGVKNVSESYWDLPTDRVSVDTSIAGDILNCPVDGSSDDLTYLMLQEPFAEPGKEYNVWRFSSVEDIGLAFICEYDAPMSSTTSSTSVVDCGSSDCSAGTASPPVESSTTNPRDDRCFCEKTDLYHDSWRIEGNKTETRRCREGAKGNATWACDYIRNTRTCQFHTEQPDFSLCHSDELEDIANSVASNDTELMTLWVSLCNFTKPDDKYFGHEIHTVLSLVTQLLNRQDWELDANETVDHLPFQIETTQIGTEVIDNLVSHDAQWNQIEQDSRSDYALYLIDVAEDLGFRLSDVAQSTNQSLRCETPLPNVTISSSYWNGYEQAQVAGCELTNSSSRVSTSTPQGDTFQRFPLTEYSGSSYITIPSESIVPGQVHKAAGVLIAHYILDRLLPGTKTEPEGLKQVNSPLISYTIKGAGLSDLEPAITNIPEGTFVQIVFQHAATAKNPPVRTLRRDLDPGEMPSAIIGSASCAFLNYTPNAHLWTDFGKLDFDKEKSWTWNGEGCFLVSTNRSHTVCKCNHLTGFSAIMDFHNYTGQSLGLEITSVTCSSFSMISLIVTFTVLTVLRSIKTDRTIITQNLCVSLALAHLLTLLTLDRHDLHLDDVTCAAMGILLHFSLVTSFMWMGVEGLRLCRIVLYVFNVVDWTLYYLLAAYVVPFLVVGFTVLSAYLTTGITSAYAGDETCWLNGENYLWAFAGPVAAIILANIVFLAIAVYSSWNLQQNKDREMPAKIKNAAAMTLSLTCLLGITWLSGFFLYTDAIAFAYIFTITNGLQGVMILLFRCVLNDEVRTALEERYRRYKDKKRMGKWPSMLTNTTTANRDRLSYVSGGSDDGKDIQNMNSKLTNIPQLSQAISQTSVSSETTTASTDTGTPQHKAVLRTFSGTEFSECSSEDRGSICSSIMEMSIKHDDISPNATRVSRRVSFLTVRDMATTSTEVLASRRRFSDLPTND